MENTKTTSGTLLPPTPISGACHRFLNRIHDMQDALQGVSPVYKSLLVLDAYCQTRERDPYVPDSDIDAAIDRDMKFSGWSKLTTLCEEPRAVSPTSKRSVVPSVHYPVQNICPKKDLPRRTHSPTGIPKNRNGEHRVAAYRMRLAARIPTTKVEKFRIIAERRDAKQEQFDRLTGMVPQVGLSMTHGLSDEVQELLEGLTTQFRDVMSDTGKNVGDRIEGLKSSINGFNDVLKDIKNTTQMGVTSGFELFLRMLWIVPFIGVAYYCITKIHTFSSVEAYAGVSMIMATILPGGLWDHIKNVWPVKPVEQDVFFDAVESQVGLFEASTLAHLISLVLTYTTIPATDPLGIAKGFIGKMSSYGSAVNSWTKLSEFLLSILESFVNYVREALGYDKIALYQTGVKAVDSWCKRVMEQVNKSHTGGEVMTPHNIQSIVALRREGTDLTNLYRFTQSVTVLLHKYLGYLDELLKLCAAAIHSFKGGRPQPAVLGLTGLPGVGKTFLCKYITSRVLSGIVPHERAIELNYDLDPEVFQKGSTEYWNGYAGQKAVIMDDWGQSVPVAGTDNDFIDLIRMANCWSYPLNFADLENKGKNFFRSDFILLTTNISNLNSAEKVINEPSAVTRRIDFGYRIEVAPSFSLNGKIDMEKIQSYILEHGDLPYHAWILYPHVFGVGSTAITNYGGAVALDEVLDSVVAKIVRNKEIFESNGSLMSEMVKRRYLEPQVGEFFTGLRKRTSDRAVQFYGIETLRCIDSVISRMETARIAIADIAQQCVEGILTMWYSNPIITFILQFSMWSMIFFVAAALIKKVIKWFNPKKKEVYYIDDAIRKCGNTEYKAQAFQLLRDEDFEEVVEKNGTLSIIKRCTPDVLLRAYNRLMSKPIEQSNEPVINKLPFKIVRGRRVIEADKPLEAQTDAYGTEIADLAANNLYVLEGCGVKGTQNFGHILMVRDVCGVMPTHFDQALTRAIENGNLTVDDNMVLRSAQNPRYIIRIRIAEFNSCKRSVFEHDDCTIIKLPTTVRAHRDIGNFFAKEADLTYLSSVRVRLDTMEPSNGSLIWRSKSMASKRKDQVTVGHGREAYTLATGYEYLGDTKNGDCGGVVCIEEAPHMQCRRILGIHVAGAPSLGLGFSNLLTQEKLETAFKKLNAVMDLTSQVQRDFKPCDAPIEGSFFGLGKGAKVHNLNPASSLVKTPLFGLWGDHPKQPAPLATFKDTEGVLVKPMAKALEPYATPVLNYLVEDVERAAFHAFSRFNDLTKDYSRKLFSFEEAVEGVSGPRGCNGVARNTSPGYPYVLEGYANKKAFFGNGGDYTFTSEECIRVRTEVESVIENAVNNIRSEHVFVDFLKDELRSHKKAMEGKSRLISSAPLNYTIAFRMYFLSFMIAVQDTRIRNGVAVGINPYTEWDYLSECMRSKGPHCVAGDYTAFDSSEQPQIHWAILERVNAWYDDGPVNARVRTILWMEVVHSRHFGGINNKCEVMYQWNKSLPSGHPATSVINSFYNLIMFNLVWTDVMGKDKACQFWDCNYICTYGDDNIVNIDPTVIGKFNQVSIQEGMLKYGMTYTTETKGDAIDKTRSLSEISFLKRGFRFEPLVGKWVGPQDLDSIRYIPYWCRNRKILKEVTCANMELTFAEMALHEPSVWTNEAVTMRNKYVAVMGVDTKQVFTRSEYLNVAMTMELPWLKN